MTLTSNFYERDNPNSNHPTFRPNPKLVMGRILRIWLSLNQKLCLGNKFTKYETGETMIQFFSSLSFDWSNPKLIVPLVFVGIGFAILFYVLKISFDSIHLKRNGTKTNGTVVGFKDVGADKYGKKSRALLVRVEVDSKDWEFQTLNYWVLPPYSIGDTVKVLYLYTNSEIPTSRMDNWEELFADSILLGAIAIVLLVLGGLLLYNFNPNVSFIF